MKTIFSITLIAALLIAATSCKSKAQKDAEKYMNKIEETVKENSPANANDEQKKNEGSAPDLKGVENIVGEWELIKVISDKNANHVIDADEEKDAITNMQDYVKFNANGTCEYTIIKMKGRYEIVTKGDGSKKLVMYDRSGTETTSGRYIISVTEKELVFNRIIAGSDFEVFKRL